MRLALAGPMGVGKTVTGRHLAARLGVPFTDLDAQIAGASSDIPSIFALHGEAGFRDREAAALAVCAEGAGVLSLGGGALLREESRLWLAAWPVVVLMARPETLAGRLEGGGSGRPLAGAWRRLYEERQAHWRSLGPWVWVDGLGVAEVTDQAEAAWAGMDQGAGRGSGRGSGRQ